MDAVTPHLSTPMTVVDTVGPQFTFFLTSEALSDFTDFLTESFLTESGFARLKDFVRDHDDAGVPNAGDMAAFGVYAGSHKLDDIGASNRDGFIFCENIGSPQGLVMSALGKRVTRRKGHRHFTTQGGRNVLAGGVHLQGGNKDLWPFFVDHSVRQAVQRISPLEYRVAIRSALLKALKVSLVRVTSMLRRNFRQCSRIRV